jgi:hypothetical protein
MIGKSVNYVLIPPRPHPNCITPTPFTCQLLAFIREIRGREWRVKDTCRKWKKREKEEKKDIGKSVSPDLSYHKYLLRIL